MIIVTFICIFCSKNKEGFDYGYYKGTNTSLYDTEMTINNVIGNNVTIKKGYSYYTDPLYAKLENISFSGDSTTINSLATSGKINIKAIPSDVKQKILDKIYPIDSLYLSYTEDDNPNTKIGGKWERLNVNRQLFCVGSKSKFKPGDKIVDDELDYYIKVENLPSHNHNLDIKSLTAESSYDHTHNMDNIYLQKAFTPMWYCSWANEDDDIPLFYGIKPYSVNSEGKSIQEITVKSGSSDGATGEYSNSDSKYDASGKLITETSHSHTFPKSNTDASGGGQRFIPKRYHLRVWRRTG